VLVRTALSATPVPAVRMPPRLHIKVSNGICSCAVLGATQPRTEILSPSMRTVCWAVAAVAVMAMANRPADPKLKKRISSPSSAGIRKPWAGASGYPAQSWRPDAELSDALVVHEAGPNLGAC
jgi:hypothetical protein